MDFEIRIIEFLQAGRSDFFDVVFQIISQLGSVLGVIALCAFFFLRRSNNWFWYLFTYGFVNLTVRIIKGTVQRIRPFNATDTILNIGDAVQDFSFPSGHAACATAIAIFLAFYLFSCFKGKWARVGIVVSCSVYVLLVCLSRMYLGKHYLTDVIAGVLISAVICAIGIWFRKFCQKKAKEYLARREANEN